MIVDFLRFSIWGKFPYPMIEPYTYTMQMPNMRR